MNKNHRSAVAKEKLAHVLGTFYCDPPYTEKVTIYKSEEAEIVILLYNATSADIFNHDTMVALEFFKDQCIYDPMSEQWYEYNSYHYEVQSEKYMINKLVNHFRDNTDSFKDKIHHRAINLTMKNLLQAVAFKLMPTKEQ